MESESMLAQRRAVVAKRMRQDLFAVNVSVPLDGECGMTEGIGDEPVADVVLPACVNVTLAVRGFVRRRAPGDVTMDDLAKGPTLEEPWVGSGAVPNDLAADAVLLVSKLEVPRSDEGHSACVMQRGGDSGAHVASEGNLGMAEQEICGACVQWIMLGGIDLLDGPEEPAEGDDNEVGSMLGLESKWAIKAEDSKTAQTVVMLARQARWEGGSCLHMVARNTTSDPRSEGQAHPC
jgi:hypothetical protein